MSLDDLYNLYETYLEQKKQEIGKDRLFDHFCKTVHLFLEVVFH